MQRDPELPGEGHVVIAEDGHVTCAETRQGDGAGQLNRAKNGLDQPAPPSPENLPGEGQVYIAENGHIGGAEPGAGDGEDHSRPADNGLGAYVPPSPEDLLSEGPDASAEESHLRFADAQPGDGLGHRHTAENGQSPVAHPSPETLPGEGHDAVAEDGQPIPVSAGETSADENLSADVDHDHGPHVSSVLAPLVVKIRAAHRRRRFFMKTQQKQDRALESFVRREMTDWHPDASEAERARENAKALAILKRARTIIAGKEEMQADDPLAIVVRLVAVSDRAREPADMLRREEEQAMGAMAMALPVWPWVAEIPGFGALGLATIIAETGDLSLYANKGKLWKRLGYAPYQGLAGSTWKRETWRPRALTAVEWQENPFSGERYALTTQIVTWLVNHQVESAEKSGTTFGRPKGLYGEVYVRRRERTAVTHADWTKAHARADALRVTMKRLLCNLRWAWNRASGEGQGRSVDNGQGPHAESGAGDGEGHARPAESQLLDAPPSPEDSVEQQAMVPLPEMAIVPVPAALHGSEASSIAPETARDHLPPTRPA